MTDKPKSPINMIDELFSKRLESNKELSEKYKKLYDYIKPFVHQNEEMEKLLNDIKFTIDISLNIDDMILSTALITSTMSMEMLRPRIPHKVVCEKCGTVCYDFTELQEQFDKEFNKK